MVSEILGAAAICALFIWGVKFGNIGGDIVISHLAPKSIIVFVGSLALLNQLFSWYWYQGKDTLINIYGGKKLVLYIIVTVCMIVGLASQNIVPLRSAAAYLLPVLMFAGYGINQASGKLHHNKYSCLMSLLLALFSTLGKWDVIARNLGITSFTASFLLVLAVGCAGWYFLWYPMITYGMELVAVWEGKSNHQSSIKGFMTVMLAYFACYLPYFFCYYPGVLSTDSIAQMSQVMGLVPFSNHHPFLHTNLIGLFYKIGYHIGNWLGVKSAINMGVAFYTIFSMLFMSFVFACVWHQLKKWKMPKWMLLLVFCFYGLLPIQGIYSVTMWKDVIFAGFLILFCLNLSHLWEDYIGDNNGGIKTKYLIRYVILSFCVCFFRGNGLYAWILTIPFMCFTFRKQWKKISVCILIVVAMILVYKKGIFTAATVSEPDYVESLSIPLQQIACVVKEGGRISTEDTILISEIVDLDKVETDYLSYISDPIKNLIRDKGKQQYLENNKASYLGAYLRIGIKNPFIYCKAFINQTKGYWFHKENNWIYYLSGVRENEIHIYRDDLLPNVATGIIEKVLIKTEELYHKFFSIGLHTYLMMFFFFTACYKRYDKKFRTQNLVVYLFPIAVWLTLLVATPVCAEFRYGYGIFIVLPLLAGQTMKNEG